MPRPVISSIVAGLGMCALAMVAALALIQPTNAQASEEFAFRIAARLHPNGTQLEFGIQRIDDQGRPRGLHLEYHRFVALDTDHHRWLYGDSSYLREAPHYDAHDLGGVNGVSVRVVARLHPTRGLFQFEAQYELDESQLHGSDQDDYVPTVFDRRQFFPEDIGHHRWLYSGEIRFTRVWSGDGTMDEGSTMEDGDNEPEQRPSTSYTIEACLIRWDPQTNAMVPGECDDLMAVYCESDPNHASCVNWRDQQ